MECKIWRVLTQILCHRNELTAKLKPFFENLNNHNINNDQSFLKEFSNYQLEVLCKSNIITEQNFNSLIPKEENPYKSIEIESDIKRIIAGDKLLELQNLIKEKDIYTFNTVMQPFIDVKEMKIPIIQYSIMKNAMQCFKFLLVNGHDDPSKAMENQNSTPIWDQISQQWITIKNYEWDCMATAIYLGKVEIMTILEERGIDKGKNPAHLEAAILSFRNEIASEIIEELSEINNEIGNPLNYGLLASSNNNNIKCLEQLIRKGVNINIHDKQSNLRIKNEPLFLLQYEIIQCIYLKYLFQKEEISI